MNSTRVALTPTSLTQEKVEAISSGLTAFLPGCKKSVPIVTMLISLNHQLQAKKGYIYYNKNKVMILII